MVHSISHKASTQQGDDNNKGLSHMIERREMSGKVKNTVFPNGLLKENTYRLSKYT